SSAGPRTPHWHCCFVAAWTCSRIRACWHQWLKLSVPSFLYAHRGTTSLGREKFGWPNIYSQTFSARGRQRPVFIMLRNILNPLILLAIVKTWVPWLDASYKSVPNPRGTCFSRPFCICALSAISQFPQISLTIQH